MSIGETAMEIGASPIGIYGARMAMGETAMGKAEASMNISVRQ
jgi:hypothetical protein